MTTNISLGNLSGFDDSTPSSDVTINMINLFYAVFLPCLSAMTIAGNLAIIVAYYKVPGLREKPSDLLILNLAVTDLLQGVTMSVFTTPLYILGSWPYREFGCKVTVGLGDVTIVASLVTLGAISLDRMLLVSKEYPRYVKIQSRFRIKLTICLCWIIAGIPMVVEIGLWEKAKEINLEASLINFNYVCLSPPRRIRGFSFFMFIAFALLPVISVTVLSAIFFHRLKRRLKRHRRIDGVLSISNSMSAATTAENSQQNISAAQRSNRRTKNRYIKPAVTLSALVCAMAICMMPYCLYVIIGIVWPSCVMGANPDILYGLILLQISSSLLDPFLYAMTQSKIKNFYISKLRRFLKFGRA